MTQAELKKVLSYDENTGVFIWKIKPSKRCKVGSVAGSLDKTSGYLYIGIDGKSYRLHRLAWLYVYGKNPINELDHRNRNKEDNSIDNLRDVTHKENMKNTPKRNDNTSGVVGVNWHKRVKRWCANIKVDGKQKHLGYFADFSDAVNARKNAEVLYEYHKNHGV